MEIVSTAVQNRFAARIAGRRGPRAWFGFLAANPALTMTVAVAGLVSAAATSAVPYLFNRFSEALPTGPEAGRWAGFLVGAFVLSAASGWVKEQAELKLVLTVRFLAFRAFFDESLYRSGEREPATGRFTTHPAQISQFAYTIDLIITLVRGLAIAVFVVLTYDIVGWVALAGILVATAVALRLVHLIGAVYARYIESESSRVDRLRDLSNAAWRLRLAGLERHVAKWIQERRDAQVPLLLQRARLQVVNGVVASAAVPSVVTIAALVFVMGAGDEASSLVALLVAAGLLASALNEAVTNYRVIRLTIPMLRAWDNRRAAPGAEVDLTVLDLIDRQPGSTWLHTPTDDVSSATYEVTRAAGGAGVWAWLSADPRIDALVLRTWVESLGTAARRELASWLMALELPADLNVANPSERMSSLSRGERHRLALAVALTASEGPCAVSSATLGAIDEDSRQRLIRRIVQGGRRIVLVGQDTCGIRVDQRIAMSLQEGRLVGAQDPEHQPPAPTGRDESEVTLVPTRSAESAAVDDGFETPRPSLTSAVRTVRMVLGFWGTASLCVAVVCASLLTVWLPVLLENAGGRNDDLLAAKLGLLLVATLVAALAVNLLQFRLPVSRLSQLHARIAQRFARVSSPRRTGELVGRFGEDFSNIQMQVPPQLVGALMLTTQLIVVVGALAVGEPMASVVVIALVPVALFLYRSGERRIVTAVAEQSHARGRFMAFCTAVLDDDPSGTHPQLRAAASTAYHEKEGEFVRASSSLVSAMMRRRTELELTGLVIFGVGTVVALTVDPVTSAIAPTVVAYFAYTIANRMPQLIEAVQSISVSIATASRVTSVLEASESDLPPTPVVSEAVRAVEDALVESQGQLLQVSGRTGVGKSIALRAVIERSDRLAVLLDDDFPARTITQEEACRAVGAPAPSGGTQRVGDLPLVTRQQLLVTYALTSTAPVVVLDESLGALPVQEQQQALAELRAAARASERTFVVVSHTNTDIHTVDRAVVVG